MEVTTALAYCLIAFVTYKLLDRLIRIPKIGNYSDRYILVTGCDTGFGHEICKRLDKMGCHVFATCLTEKGEEELKKQCSNKVKTISMDVSKNSSVRKAYKQVSKALPPGKGLWGIINNAGISGVFGPCEWLTLDNYQEVLEINLLGLIDVTVTFLPLVKREKGRIVNTASMMGRCSFVGSTPYCISKYGVESFSDSIRRQLRGFGVSVHIIEPGFYKTNICSVDHLGSKLREAWSQASPEVRDEYGEEFIEASLELSLNTLITRITSDKISDVLEAYEQALLGKYPRARYLVGNDARFIFLPLFCWFPEWLGDWLLNVLGRPYQAIPKVLKTGKKLI